MGGGVAVTLLTIAEYARHRGCDEKAVRKALTAGRISRLSAERKCLDPTVADIQWAENTRARADSAGKAGAAPAVGKSGQGGTSGDADEPDDYKGHRARREKAAADRAEVLALRERQLVLMREPAERAIFDLSRSLRDAAFQALRDAAPKVRDLNESREIQLVLENELRQAFTNFDVATRQRLAELAAEARP